MMISGAVLRIYAQNTVGLLLRTEQNDSNV